MFPHAWFLFFAGSQRPRSVPHGPATSWSPPPPPRAPPTVYGAHDCRVVDGTNRSVSVRVDSHCAPSRYEHVGRGGRRRTEETREGEIGRRTVEGSIIKVYVRPRPCATSVRIRYYTRPLCWRVRGGRRTLRFSSSPGHKRVSSSFSRTAAHRRHLRRLCCAPP